MKKLSERTGKSRGKRAELLVWIERAAPGRIGAAEFERLRTDLAVSETYLRKLLRDSGTPLVPMVEGVRQGSFEELERTLNALCAEYCAGDDAQRATARRLVIAAKDHARWAARRGHPKDEMILWMLTWLENPPLFPQWVRLRRSVL